MIPVELIRDRFDNVRLVQKDLMLAEVNMTFNETDLKTIIYYLNDYIAIKEASESEGKG